MFKSLLSTLLLLTYLSQAHSASIKSHPQAKLGQGLAIGRSINGIDSWRSIPYAQKPVESLRLMPPISPKGFTGKQHFYKDPDACFNVNSTAPVPSSLSDEQEEKLNKLLADALVSFEKREKGWINVNWEVSDNFFPPLSCFSFLTVISS